MYSVLRLGDSVQCTCFPPIPPPLPAPPIPCPNGFISSGSVDTFIEDRAVARLGDSSTNCCGGTCFCPNQIITGSQKTFVNNRPVARTIDTITCGRVTGGSIKTFIQ